MAATPRPAATILLLRDSPWGIQTWLMERNRSVGFMASAWVFPGGRVDEGDGDRPAIGGTFQEVPKEFWVAAARELEEEAGVSLKHGDAYDLRHMRLWAHWITPEMEPRRYDTWFFAAALPEGAEARIDGHEAVAGRWFRPDEALALWEKGELLLAPPTVRCLQELLAVATVAEALLLPRRLVPICPRFALLGEEVYTLMPGDPEFPSEHPVDPPTRFLVRWNNETLKAMRHMLQGSGG